MVGINSRRQKDLYSQSPVIRCGVFLIIMSDQCVFSTHLNICYFLLFCLYSGCLQYRMHASDLHTKTT